MRVIRQFQSDHEAEYRHRREPALRHLEAIEPLFHEFRTPEVAVQYYILLVECLRAYESHQALDYCCDAVLAAEEKDPDDVRIGIILSTAVAIRKYSRDFERAPLDLRDAVYRRVGQILYPRLKVRMEAARIGAMRRWRFAASNKSRSPVQLAGLVWRSPDIACDAGGMAPTLPFSYLPPGSSSKYHRAEMPLQVLTSIISS